MSESKAPCDEWNQSILGIARFAISSSMKKRSASTKASAISNRPNCTKKSTPGEAGICVIFRRGVPYIDVLHVWWIYSSHLSGYRFWSSDHIFCRSFGPYANRDHAYD